MTQMADTPTQPTLMDRALAASRAMDFAAATELARAALAENPLLATGQYEPLFRMMAHGATPEQVARLGPARLNTLVHTGWLHSLYAGIPVNAAGDPLPWITYPAIDFLEQKISPDWSVLEWGCGQSTLWWAARVRRVVSIEHDADWQQQTAARAPANASVHWVSAADTYADAAPAGEELFDVTLIDGEDRNRCARTALRRTRPSGLIVFDNSDRRSVRDGLTCLTEAGWQRIDFFGLLPSFAYRICTSVFFRDASLLARGPLPCDSRSSLGPTLSQVLDE